jgi:uncharacterized membrane protein
MTDEQHEPAVVDAVVAVEADDTGATVVGAIGDETGTRAVGAIVTDYEYAVVVAAFADEDAARAAYETLTEAESEKALDIVGVLVVKTDATGKVKVQEMTDHSTKTGVKWGVAGGIVLGIIFPPSVLASAVGFGAVGGMLGKIRNVAHRSQISQLLAETLGPNQSGIVALLKAGDLESARQAMPEATKVRTAGVDEQTAKEVSEAAKQAG